MSILPDLWTSRKNTRLYTRFQQVIAFFVCGNKWPCSKIWRSRMKHVDSSALPYGILRFIMQFLYSLVWALVCPLWLDRRWSIRYTHTKFASGYNRIEGHHRFHWSSRPCAWRVRQHQQNRTGAPNKSVMPTPTEVQSFSVNIQP